MKVSNLVFNYLKNQGLGTVFMLSGGGIMHLVDSLGRSGIKYVCCHHEQAAAIAAQANAMYRNSLGCCLVTTGPGGTNALTGTAAAYMDSTPVLFLSGQVKRSDFASLRGVRQFGAQENNIIDMVKPITKYAVLLEKPEDILYELEKCVYYATQGRQGPVWLDIPLDVQADEVDENNLRHFSPLNKISYTNMDKSAEYTVDCLNNAQRPVILIGHGVIASKSAEIIRRIVEKIKIPVMSTWRALGIFDSDDDIFFGSPGLQAPRYSNIIIQNSDLLIVLGSRLDNMITAFNEEHFAYQAKKIIVDVDENEIRKLHMSEIYPVVGDVADYLQALDKKSSAVTKNFTRWIENCRNVKFKFPILNERQDKIAGVNLYAVTEEISKHTCKDDAVVISSTSRCNTAGHIALNRKQGQKSVSSMGLGSMGFALPSAIGVGAVNGVQRVIVIEGDGSFQLNLQELETIVSNKITAKIFIFSNRGYAAIQTMQDRNFNSFYVGCNESSGVFLPSTEKISNAYGINYLRINNNEEIRDKVNAAMNMEGSVLCEICGSATFDEIPKCISHIEKKTGKRVSAFLENPYPFLSGEDLNVITKDLLNC